MRRDELRSKSARQELLAISALLLFLALRFLPTVVDGLIYAPFHDNVFIYGPMFSETARIALHGETPFYLPSFGTGFPLFQSPHYSPFYPFYFFGLLDYGGPLESLYTLTRLTLFHRVILALNFFVMLRAATVSPTAAFVGAAIGTVAFNTEMYSGWITIAASYTWLPLLVAGGILLLRGARYTLATFFVGISAGLLALASASQSIAHTLLFCIIFFGVGTIWIYKTRGLRQVGKLLSCLTIAAAIAFGISAVSVVPVFLDMDGMIRHIGASYLLGHQPIPWEKFNLEQLALGNFSAILINPGSVEIVGSPYIGPLGLAGVVLAVILFPRLSPFQRLLVLSVGGVGLYALLSAFGTNLGFSYLNYHLPFINKIREAGRHLVLFVIAVVLLSGIGFDQLGRAWRQGGVSLSRHRLDSFTVYGLLLIFLLAAVWELSIHTPLARGGALVLMLAPGVMVGSSLLRIQPFWLNAVPAAFVSLAAAISPVRTFAPQSGDYFQSNNLRSLAVLSAVRDKVGSGDFRLDFADREISTPTWAMNASYFGFHSFYNQLTPQPYDQFRFSLLRKPPLLHQLMGARYVLCGRDEKPSDRAAIARFTIEQYTVFENPSYMDRLTLLHSLAGTYKDETEFIGWSRRSFDFNRSVFLGVEDAAGIKPFLRGNVSSNAAGNDVLNRKHDSVNCISAHVHASRPGFVVLNEWFSRAWKVRVNGTFQPAVRANWWQVGVPVKQGDNAVEFIYRPELCWVLLILNRVTWSVIGLFVVGQLFYHLRRRLRLGSCPHH